MKRTPLLTVSFFLISIIVLIGVVSCSGAPKGGPIELRYATPGPPDHPGTMTQTKMCENFSAEASSRGYTMKMYSGGVLGNSLEQMNSIRNGSIDAGDAAWGFFGAQEPAFSAPTVPFLLNNLDAAFEFTQQPEMELLDQIVQEKFNMKLFSLTVYGTAGIVSKDKPLRTPADFKGQLVAINTPLQGEYIEALGGAPVVIDWNDDVPSLQKGLVTASILSSPAGLYPMGYYDVCKYYTDNKLYAGCMVVAMNLDTYEEMPKAVQNMLLEAGKDFAVDQYQTFKQVEADFTKALEDEGMTLIYLTPEERAEWVKAVQPVVDNYWASLPAELAEGLQAAAERANSKFP